MKKSYIHKLSEYKYQINQFDKSNFFKSIFELLDNNVIYLKKLKKKGSICFNIF